MRKKTKNTKRYVCVIEQENGKCILIQGILFQKTKLNLKYITMQVICKFMSFKLIVLNQGQADAIEGKGVLTVISNPSC